MDTLHGEHIQSKIMSNILKAWPPPIFSFHIVKMRDICSEDFRRRGAVSRSSIRRPCRRLRHTFAQRTVRDAAVHRSRGRLYARLFPVLCAALLSAIEANDVALGGIRAHRKEGQADFKGMRCERFWCGDKKRTTVSSARTDESSVPSPPPLADALHLQETLGSLQSKLRAGFVSGIVQVLF